MSTKEHRVVIDPTNTKLAERKRGGMTWTIQPGLPPVATLLFGIIFLFTWSLFMNIWFQIFAGPVVMFFVFLLGREYEKRKATTH